jgi:hypothetical protein
LYRKDSVPGEAEFFGAFAKGGYENAITYSMPVADRMQYNLEAGGWIFMKSGIGHFRKFHIVYPVRCVLSWELFISSNKCTVLCIMYFTINLLLHVSVQLPFSVSYTSVVRTYSNKTVSQ